MKTITKIAVVTGVALLFTGCAGSTSPQPIFNPNNKHIVFVEGKPYRVPYGTKVSKHIINSKNITRYNNMGFRDCRKGDITWMEVKTKKAASKKSLSEKTDFVLKAVRDGKAGCAAPLPESEHQYYFNHPDNPFNKC